MRSLPLLNEFMGFTPINKITINRDFKTREIVVTWRDDILGEKEKRFTFEQKEEAMAFATKEFNSLAM